MWHKIPLQIAGGRNLDPSSSILSALRSSFGRDNTVSISEGQCLWTIRSLLPQLPVPEIYGWSTEAGYVLLYMELVNGVTVETRWDSMTAEEKLTFVNGMRSVVGELRTLRQDPADIFLGT